MNQVYSPDNRINALNLYAAGVPVNEIMQQTGFSHSYLYALISKANLLRQRDTKTNLMDGSPSKQVHTVELAKKKKLIDGFLASENKTRYAAEHGVPRSTLYRWSKKDDIIQGHHGRTINIKMYDESLRINEKLLKMIAVLQSVHCSVFAPLPVKMAEMDRLNNDYGRNVLCDALLVDRATYFNHLKRNKRENSWFVIRREELKTAIEKTYHEHNQIPGIRKVHALLKQKGYQVSIHMVGELMKELGLVSIRNSAKQIYLSTVKEYENEINLKNQFPCYLPNQLWRSDFTFFPVGDIKYCICIIMDACTRVIIAYKVGRKATTQMLTQCFKKAINIRKINPDHTLVFHSDQGAQYTSYAFKNLLRQYGIKQSFSRRGKPTDNAMIESFNRSFKTEALYCREIPSERKFKKLISEYIEKYYTERPHESLNYDTPMHYEQKLLKQDSPTPDSTI